MGHPDGGGGRKGGGGGASSAVSDTGSVNAFSTLISSGRLSKSEFRAKLAEEGKQTDVMEKGLTSAQKKFKKETGKTPEQFLQSSLGNNAFANSTTKRQREIASQLENRRKGIIRRRELEANARTALNRAK